MTINLKPLYADHVLDLRHLSLDNAAREISQFMIGVELGGSIEVIVSDPEEGEELITWAKTAGHHIIGSSGDSECQRIYVERQR